VAIAELESDRKPSCVWTLKQQSVVMVNDRPIYVVSFRPELGVDAVFDEMIVPNL
jgi:hypothetical protein